jgi:hypothetical protein
VYLNEVDDGHLIHEFKHLEEYLFFDDAGSEIELNGYEMLESILSYLSEGYYILIAFDRFVVLELEPSMLPDLLD